MIDDTKRWPVTAIIPAYNEAARIAPVLDETANYVDEVIVVDDGSTDETARVARDRGVHVHRFRENQGYGAALEKGIELAGNKVVVILDADGEHPPEAIPRLVEPIVAGRAHMVQGSRAETPRWSELVITRVCNLVAPVGDSGTGMRALLTEVGREVGIVGPCLCGILALQVHLRGYVIKDVPIRIRAVAKARRVAWHHGKQVVLLFPVFLRAVKHRIFPPRKKEFGSV